MPITTTPKIWMNGSLVNWEDAKVHVLTHTLHYGTGVFEGIRAYDSKWSCSFSFDRPHEALAQQRKNHGHGVAVFG